MKVSIKSWNVSRLSNLRGNLFWTTGGGGGGGGCWVGLALCQDREARRQGGRKGSRSQHKEKSRAGRLLSKLDFLLGCEGIAILKGCSV